MYEISSVQLHLQMLQDVINRMASNSANAKTWCITLVSAIIILAADKENPQVIEYTLLPVIMFYILDVYYLAYEKAFRASYNKFVDNLPSNLEQDVIYRIFPEGNIWKHRKDALISFSTTGFYILFALVLFFHKLSPLSNAV